MTESGSDRVDDVRRASGRSPTVTDRWLRDAVDEPIFEVDRDGRIVEANDAFADLLETDGEDHLGDPLSEHLEDAPFLENEFQRHREQGEATTEATVDVTFRTTTGDRAPRKLRLQYAGGSNGESAGIDGEPTDSDGESAGEGGDSAHTDGESIGGDAEPRERIDDVRAVGVVETKQTADDRTSDDRTVGGTTDDRTSDDRTVGGTTDDRTSDDGLQSELASVWETYGSITSALDEAAVGVFVLDESFRVAWIDATAERYFGIDREAVIGRDKRSVIRDTIRDRLADPDAFERTVLRTYEDNTHDEEFEFRVTEGPDRAGRWLEHRSRPIESGQYAGGRVEVYYDVTDRKASDESQQQSDVQFRSLVDAVTEYAIFLMEPDGTVASWNRGAERIKGYDAETIVGQHFSQFYTDEEREAGIPERNVQRAIEHGYSEDEGWRVRADGSRFWASVTITAIRGDDGDLEGFAKVTRDMTDRREREQALQRERDLIDRILETSPVGIALVNHDGSLDRANERMAALLETDLDATSTDTAGDRDLADEDGRLLPVDERPAGRVFETGEPVFDQEIRLERSDGQDRWLSLNATPIASGDDDPEQVVLSATDITHLKRLAEQRKRALQEREEALSAVQLSTDLLEPDEQPVEELLEDFASELPPHFHASEATVAHVAVGAHEVTTGRFGDRADQNDEGATGADSEAGTADDAADFAYSITGRTLTENGTPIVVEIRRSDAISAATHEQFLEEEQELVDTLATLLKFHFDRREYIRDLQAETERLEQFAYAASHDMQEPLRMVSTYLQLIERRYGDALDEDGREYLQFAVDGADRMHDMIDGLLTYSRVETQGDPFEPVDLEPVVTGVLEDLQLRIQESGADVSVGSLPPVQGDPDQLRQVFQNLLDNAIEYSGEAPPRIDVRAERAGDRWQIAVSDGGIGVDPDDTDRIFEVFERLHGRGEYSGTGIGLAVCERIVERHGGEIWVDSQPGEGTTVSFTLPAAE